MSKIAEYSNIIGYPIVVTLHPRYNEDLKVEISHIKQDTNSEIYKAIKDTLDGTDFILGQVYPTYDNIIKFDVFAYDSEGKEMSREVELDIKDETYDLFFGKINEKEMIIKVVINKKKYKNDIFGIYFQAYNCEINRFLKIPLKCDSHDKRSISFQEIFDKNIIKDYFGEECDNIKFNLFITKLHI